MMQESYYQPRHFGVQELKFQGFCDISEVVLWGGGGGVEFGV